MYEEWNPEDMTAEELRECLARLEKELARLDAREPADETCEAYEAWADEHEELEDRIDDVMDLLDEREA